MTVIWSGITEQGAVVPVQVDETGKVVATSSASGEYVLRSGDTMTGLLISDSIQCKGAFLAMLPTGGTATGLSNGTAPFNGMNVAGVKSNTDVSGSISTQSSSSIANVALSKKGNVITGGKYMQFAHTGDLAGSITVQSTSSINYNNTSDYRLKENVTPISGAIDKIKALKPCTYNFISDPDMSMSGFLAHEVQTVLPTAVTGEKDAVDEEGKPDYQQLDYSKLTPLLTAALQETLVRVAALESQLSTRQGGN